MRMVPPYRLETETTIGKWGNKMGGWTSHTLLPSVLGPLTHWDSTRAPSTDEEFQDKKSWALERMQVDHSGGMCVNISTSSSPILSHSLIFSVRVQETYWLYLGFSWGRGQRCKSSSHELSLQLCCNIISKESLNLFKELYCRTIWLQQQCSPAYLTLAEMEAPHVIWGYVH